jgi:TonB family protein
VGVLLVAGILITLTMKKENAPSITSNEKPIVKNETNKIIPPAPLPDEEIKTATDTLNKIAETHEEIKEQLDTSIASNQSASTIQQTVIPKTESEKNKKSKAALKTNNPDTFILTDKKLALKEQTQSNKDSPAVTLSAGSSKAKEQENRIIGLNEDASEKTEKADAIKTIDELPEFPGGKVALNQYIHNNLKYPKNAKENKVEGKVNLSFTIGTSGRVKNIHVITGVSKEINAEAIRLISNMPSWKPGKQGGKAVVMTQSLTIEFKIEER